MLTCWSLHDEHGGELEVVVRPASEQGREIGSRGRSGLRRNLEVKCENFLHNFFPRWVHVRVKKMGLEDHMLKKHPSGPDGVLAITCISVCHVVEVVAGGVRGDQRRRAGGGGCGSTRLVVRDFGYPHDAEGHVP